MAKKAESKTDKEAGDPTEPRDLICDRCGAHSPPNSAECVECGANKFAPKWVEEIRRVNRSVAVQITSPHPLSESTDSRLTLYKWWPGGKSTFNIPNAQQWERVRSIVDHDLAPILGWPPPLAPPDSDTVPTETEASNSQLENLASTEPIRLAKFLKSIDLSKVTDNDIEQIGNVLSAADDGLRGAIRSIVAQLPAQGAHAIRELSLLMESLTVAQITNVTLEVRRRLGLLEAFRDRALDDRTYEIQGEASIHRLLERAMWIVDERYWLLHSNRALRTVVGDQLAKEDKKFSKRRPDFVCGTVDKKLIIIELKRPSHRLDIADLNQLERYVVICDEYSKTHTSFEALLVGSKQTDDLRRTLKVRGGNRFQVRTYAELIDDAERRYEGFIKAMDQKDS
jgi:ribosomal protein L40E